MMLESGRRYLGQMDLNIESPLVWDFYDETLRTLSAYGARIVRLDAFAYAPKTPGKKNFLNEPDTWDLLERVRALADKYGLTLLPEIHESYNEKTYEKIAARGYITYDFFLPGLIIDALERHTGDLLIAWAKELRDRVFARSICSDVMTGYRCLI
jgi:sucrose phosphorylase